MGKQRICLLQGLEARHVHVRYVGAIPNNENNRNKRARHTGPDGVHLLELSHTSMCANASMNDRHHQRAVLVEVDKHGFMKLAAMHAGVETKVEEEDAAATFGADLIVRAVYQSLHRRVTEEQIKLKWLEQQCGGVHASAQCNGGPPVLACA